MWNRKELKARGKSAFKANYWLAVLMAVILMAVAGGGTGLAGSAGSAGFNVNYNFGQSDTDAKDENYYAIFNSPAFGKCLLVFSPNEQILEGMRPHLDKLIVLKVFYQNNGR